MKAAVAAVLGSAAPCRLLSPCSLLF